MYTVVRVSSDEVIIDCIGSDFRMILQQDCEFVVDCGVCVVLLDCVCYYCIVDRRS